ncbi:MAG TPA: chloride channel protein [Burkholderiaceae bacterium]
MNKAPATPSLILMRRRVTLWFWAMLVGGLAAAVTLSFRATMHGMEWLLTRHSGELVSVAQALAPWQRLVVCTLGAAAAGLVMVWGKRWAERGPAGSQNLDYIDAVRTERVDLNDRMTIVRSGSALLSIASGASIGREGPMVQLAAWMSTVLARVLPLGHKERVTLLVAGIAAGIAAAYHAPVAGVVFVLELALGFMQPGAITPVLIAAATSSGIIYYLVEPAPIYNVGNVEAAPTSLGLALLAGLVFGAIGWAFLHLLEGVRKQFARLRSPVSRLALGGFLVGLLSMAVPEVWGNGYPLVADALNGTQTWQWLLMVLVAKVLATTLSSGSGAVGGVFTPSLCLGATGGAVLAQWAAMCLPASWVGDPRALAILGMAAVLAAVTHAPLMAIVMVMEMTHQFQFTVPAMLACGVAYAVSTQFGVEPLYGNPIEATR